MGCLFWRFAPGRWEDELILSTTGTSILGGIHSTLVSNASCVCDLGYIIFIFHIFPCVLSAEFFCLF